MMIFFWGDGAGRSLPPLVLPLPLFLVLPFLRLLQPASPVQAGLPFPYSFRGSAVLLLSV